MSEPKKVKVTVRQFEKWEESIRKFVSSGSIFVHWNDNEENCNRFLTSNKGIMEHFEKKLIELNDEYFQKHEKTNMVKMKKRDGKMKPVLNPGKLQKDYDKAVDVIYDTEVEVIV